MTTPEQPAGPVRVTGTCQVCGGPIRYWARLASDPKPRTTAVDDQDRWQHDRIQDWIHQPHRARPVAPAATPG